MAAYAATTSRIRLGQMCTAMSYRNPAYLAKVAATTDVISGGRMQMGIGGGWYEHEWRAYGYGFPSAGVRLARLDEGVQIMRDAWRDGGSVSRVSSTRSTGRSSRRSRCKAWHSDLGRRGRGEGDAEDRREVRPVHQLHLRAGRFAHKSQVLEEHCLSGHRLRCHRAVGQRQRDRGRHRGRRRAADPAGARPAGAIAGEGAADAMMAMFSGPGRRRAPPSRSSNVC